MSADWRIEPLQRHHVRTRFSCGEPELDNYLAHLAGQHHRSGVSRTCVAVNDSEPNRVLGYYSLAAGAADKAHLPPADARHFPDFPLPIARLARLAVDHSQQRKGIGEDLLIDALARCSRAAEDLGIAAVIIDAKHERAKAFYSRYGFTALPDQPLTLWQLLPAIRKLIQPSGLRLI